MAWNISFVKYKNWTRFQTLVYTLQVHYRRRKSNLTLVKMRRWILGDLLFFTLPMDSALISRLSSARRRLRGEKGRGTHESKQWKSKKWKNCLRRLPGQVCFVGINWGLHATPLSAHVAQTLAGNLKFPGSLFGFRPFVYFFCVNFTS